MVSGTGETRQVKTRKVDESPDPDTGPVSPRKRGWRRPIGMAAALFTRHRGDGHHRAARRVATPDTLPDLPTLDSDPTHAAPKPADMLPKRTARAPDPPLGRDDWAGRARRRLSRFFNRYVFTSLTQRIVILNMGALVVLLVGIVFLNQFRDSLIEAREESLLTQGEIIASAIAARAGVDADAITIDPDRLLELKAGESTYPMPSPTENLDFSINPEDVAPLMTRLITPTRTRARLYDRDGIIIIDSARLYSRGQILRGPLDEPDKSEGWSPEALWLRFRNWFWQSDLPLYEETPGGNGTAYGEVVQALTGTPAARTRRTDGGDTIVSVAIPVQRFRAVLGVLLLSTEAGDIDEILEQERLAIARTFAVAAGVALLLSILLAWTIASPLRRLSAAAQRVRRGVNTREQIPDFSYRRDEIGHLSGSLAEMTEALYARIEAIESFAADVSHELKNPLTSLRSAVETLPLARKSEQRDRLLAVIEHDVQRLDRLISDISDASRLDAELARADASAMDLVELLKGFHATHKALEDGLEARDDTAGLPELVLDLPKPDRRPLVVSGHEGRLGQVLANLIENARGFVPQDGGRISVRLRRKGDDEARITVSDNGPGIPEHDIERIFERFYTDRPDGEDFGQNSGLGLSISRQIVEAHGGTIRADRAPAEDGGGARFTVTLPLIED